MAVNLRPAQAAIERLMSDRVRLWRNPLGHEDDTMEPDAGNLDLDDLFAAYPRLTVEDVKAVLDYAREAVELQYRAGRQ